MYTGLFPIIFADLQPPSQNICLATVDLNSCSHYLLAALHPFSSILTRRVGPKRVILLSLLLFSAASVAAGLSSSLESLIAWRVVQGAGGGLLIPVGQALT
ncbi:multidrug efflux MFS transporter, partial [Enterobacter hormaechei]|nr:multidrug efflux MFS transporter [Enterobacter hormaechei]